MDELLREDLNAFLKAADEYHINFYHSHSRKELEKYIRDYMASNQVENENQLLYMIKSIIKFMSADKDCHTKINLSHSTFIPMKWVLIDNELYIDNTIDDNFSKAKVLKINNVPISDLISELEPIICYATKGWFEKQIELELRRVETLSILPSINHNLTNVEILTDKGLLVIDSTKRYPNRPSQNKTYRIINDTLIFRYKACEERCAPNIGEIAELIYANNIKKFVVDMRNNSGGNQTILYPLINYLKEISIDVDVLVDKGVFSSARWNIIDLQNIGAHIIGENIGTPLNCFGCNNKAGSTPNYGFLMTFSKWYITYDKDLNMITPIKTREELDKLNPNTFANIYLKIDEKIDYTLDDFYNDVDPFIKHYEDKNKVQTA